MAYAISVTSVKYVTRTKVLRGKTKDEAVEAFYELDPQDLADGDPVSVSLIDDHGKVIEETEL